MLLSCIVYNTLCYDKFYFHNTPIIKIDAYLHLLRSGSLFLYEQRDTNCYFLVQK